MTLMLGLPARRRLPLVANLLLFQLEVFAVQPHLSHSDWGGLSHESISKPAVNLLKLEELNDFEKGIKDDTSKVSEMVQQQLAQKLQSTKEFVDRALHKFKDALEKVLADSFKRAQRIEDQMQATSVAISHGKFNGEKSSFISGKCCCHEASEDPDCEWYDTEKLQGGSKACPGEHHLEYTDLLKESVFESGTRSFVDSRQIELILDKCVKSEGWQARQGHPPGQTGGLPPEAVIGGSGTVEPKVSEAGIKQFDESCQIMRDVQLPPVAGQVELPELNSILDKACVPITGKAPSILDNHSLERADAQMQAKYLWTEEAEDNQRVMELFGKVKGGDIVSPAQMKMLEEEGDALPHGIIEQAPVTVTNQRSDEEELRREVVSTPGGPITAVRDVREQHHVRNSDFLIEDGVVASRGSLNAHQDAVVASRGSLNAHQDGSSERRLVSQPPAQRMRNSDSIAEEQLVTPLRSSSHAEAVHHASVVSARELQRQTTPELSRQVADVFETQGPSERKLMEDQLITTERGPNEAAVLSAEMEGDITAKVSRGESVDAIVEGYDPKWRKAVREFIEAAQGSPQTLERKNSLTDIGDGMEDLRTLQPASPRKQEQDELVEGAKREAKRREEKARTVQRDALEARQGHSQLHTSERSANLSAQRSSLLEASAFFTSRAVMVEAHHADAREPRGKRAAK